jgi:HEPN domain-containing protein
MATYWDIAKEDLEHAVFLMEAKRNKYAVLSFQQFAEKGAKALLEKKDSAHKALRSHQIETIIVAYDVNHSFGEISDKARYLTSFYFDSRYPGDNYVEEITDAQVEHAFECASRLNVYYQAEWVKVKKLSSAPINGINDLPKLEVGGAEESTRDFNGTKKEGI